MFAVWEHASWNIPTLRDDTWLQISRGRMNEGYQFHVCVQMGDATVWARWPAATATSFDDQIRGPLIRGSSVSVLDSVTYLGYSVLTVNFKFFSERNLPAQRNPVNVEGVNWKCYKLQIPLTRLATQRCRSVWACCCTRPVDSYRSGS